MLTFGLMIAIAVWILEAISLGRMAHGLLYSVLIGLALGLLGGLIFGIVRGVGSGLVQIDVVTPAIPNEGIRRSAYAAIAFGLALGVALGLAFGLLFLLTVPSSSDPGLPDGPGPTGIVVAGVLWGLCFGLFGGIRNGGGDCIRHAVLRLLLWCNGFAPWNYSQFLDHAARRIFLLKVGGGYIFVHRLLRDHFAAQWKPRSADEPPEFPAAA